MRSCLFAFAVLAVGSTNAFTPPKASTLQTHQQQQQSLTQKSAIVIPLPDQQDNAAVATNANAELAPQDAWVANLDYEGFGKEVSLLGKRILAEENGESVQHLEKIVSWRNIAALVGVATVWTTPNPLTIVALSTWTYASWTMIAHHTCHGGYNRLDAGNFNSRGFAIGSVVKRAQDWLDWMKPEAWNIEHNRLHHYRLNEFADPDLVQRNVGFIRESPMPVPMRYVFATLLSSVWKWYYYAPNTYKELKIREFELAGKPLPQDFKPAEAITIKSFFRPESKSEEALSQLIKPSNFLMNVVGPFFVGRFVLLPLPLLAIPGVGPTLYTNAIINLIAAELFTNMHSFLTIVTNHAGEDLYTFEDAVKPRSPSFYVRQIVGSANYAYGSDPVDFVHGFLNYQVEHHVWPDLSMRQYQKAAPELKAICDKYGVPYVKESVFERLRKTLDIMVGKSSMRTFPVQYEPAKDKAKTVAWTSDNGSIDGDDKV